MIIVAILLVAIATILIAVDFVRNLAPNANLGTLGLAFLSGGVLAYLIYVADAAGKL